LHAHDPVSPVAAAGSGNSCPLSNVTRGPHGGVPV